MKRSWGVLLSLAIALAGGMAIIHRAAKPPASTLHRPLPLLPGTVADGSRVVVEEQAPAAGLAESDRSAEVSQHDIAALREEVALLSKELAVLRRQFHTQRRVATRAAPRSEDAPTSNPRFDPTARAVAERERQAQMAVREATFRQEPTDRRWADDAVGVVQVALASDDTVQNTLLGLECRSFTCRVELADDDTGELAKVLPLFLQQLGEALPYVTADYVADGAGGKRMVLYMSQQANVSLPAGK